MATYDLIPEHFTSNMNDVLTVEMIAKELEYMSGFPRSKGAIQTGGSRATFKFLAPEEIAENIAHSWEEYESPATKLSQGMGMLKSAVGKGEHAAEEAMKSVEKGGKNIDSMQGVAKGLTNVTLAGDEGILNYRIDAPLVYKSSQRREYTITLPLGAYDSQTNEQNIYQAIKELEKLSCAEMDEESIIRMKFPAIFTIKTQPVNIINIRTAALTAVQPTGKYPFRKGYSMNVELQLTFIDIQPTYQKSITQGGIVRAE